MHLVVGDVASLSEVDGVDDLIVAVGFVTIKILCLPSVTYTC